MHLLSDAENDECKGIIAQDKDGNEFEIHTENTIWASGGIGGRYKHSTNFPHLTGDALTISEKHGIRLEHLDYVPSFSISSLIALVTTSLGRSSFTKRSFLLLRRTAPSPRTDSEIRKRLPGFLEYNVVGWKRKVQIMSGCPWKNLEKKPSWVISRTFINIVWKRDTMLLDGSVHNLNALNEFRVFRKL